jgi:hypothetical protein
MEAQPEYTPTHFALPVGLRIAQGKMNNSVRQLRDLAPSLELQGERQVVEQGRTQLNLMNSKSNGKNLSTEKIILK